MTNETNDYFVLIKNKFYFFDKIENYLTETQYLFKGVVRLYLRFKTK